MIKGRRETKMVGIFGSESTGKTTTAYMLTGKLRTHGVLADVVTGVSAAMPFHPSTFDTHEAAWMYVFTKKIMREVECALRSNIEVIISDRTPLDLFSYFFMKHPDSPLIPALTPLVAEWMNYYDLLYFLPAEGTEFRNDGFREPTDESRNKIDSVFSSSLEDMKERYGDKLRIADGTYRERAEFIYHDALAELTGKVKTRQVVEQVKHILDSKGLMEEVTEVRMLGSRSITRHHIASDNDDYDLLIVTEGDAPALYEVIQKLLPYLEHTCEADLDIAVCTKDTMPHEV